MRIECLGCSAQYEFAVELLADAEAAVRCPACGLAFLVGVGGARMPGSRAPRPAVMRLESLHLDSGVFNLDVLDAALSAGIADATDGTLPGPFRDAQFARSALAGMVLRTPTPHPAKQAGPPAKTPPKRALPRGRGPSGPFPPLPRRPDGRPGPPRQTDALPASVMSPARPDPTPEPPPQAPAAPVVEPPVIEPPGVDPPVVVEPPVVEPTPVPELKPFGWVETRRPDPADFGVDLSETSFGPMRTPKPIEPTPATPQPAAPKPPRRGWLLAVAGAVIAAGGLWFWSQSTAAVEADAADAAPPALVAAAHPAPEAQLSDAEMPDPDAEAPEIEAPEDEPEDDDDRPLRLRREALHAAFTAALATDTIVGSLLSIDCAEAPCVIYGQVDRFADTTAVLSAPALNAYRSDQRFLYRWQSSRVNDAGVVVRQYHFAVALYPSGQPADAVRQRRDSVAARYRAARNSGR
jgi:DNA-directed RNA polymerase subunit RPC12/RpoP